MIEVEGARGALDDFEHQLKTSSPRFSTIDACASVSLAVEGTKDFRIETSFVAGAATSPRVTADIATCAACLAELDDPTNRRFRYPFITCAGCGPRLTVVTGVPYDRERTTMAAFTMCGPCRREYDDPADRRFDAQTIACWDCGPQLTWCDPSGMTSSASPMEAAADLLTAGRIVAVKGLGGYHLACDATNSAAVQRLRQRKHRDAQPFAVMFESADAVSAVCAISAREQQLLLASTRPIVLLTRRRHPEGLPLAEAVAPGCATVGAMLAPTPLHHLLLKAAGGPLVMTSGNRSHEPTIADDDAAVLQLADIADALLMHNRVIHVRCDDSVTRVANERELPLRRSRGYAPHPIHLPLSSAVPTLAVGGQLKNTFALGYEHDATISHHVGDLDDLTAYRAFMRDITLYERLFNTGPRLLVHDRHPGYASTRYALERAALEGQSTLAVQHHHAHIASCLAEHGTTTPVIGVAFDGTGFGDDGTIWGGEFLIGDLVSVRRAASLRPVAMPGGDLAVREPWRMALSHLLDAGEDTTAIRGRVGQGRCRIVTRMIERRVNAPLTSSAGRLFDAIAAIAGLRDAVSFEGQAAMELESLAASVPPDGAYDAAVDGHGEGLVIDTRPVIRAARADHAAGVAAAKIARRFHSGLTNAIVSVCVALRGRTGLATVVLTGGVFQNALLTVDCDRQLTEAGFRVLRHHLVPPGDGGISLGQLAVAAARSHVCA